jgi:hypothetical protein
VWRGDLDIQPIQDTPEMLKYLSDVDKNVLGFTRQVDHQWLMSDRQGYLYLRHGQVVGYGYLGVRNGPFALLDQADFPVVLAHAEGQSAAQGREEFGLEIPLVNQVAVNYLLGRNFRIDTFLAVLMVDEPFARFENYILTSPPFFL